MSATSPDVAEVHDRLADDTLLVFVSDVHTGGVRGSGILSR